MDFYPTTAGTAAAVAAGSNGPKISITAFRIGSVANYTPTPGDTDIRGTNLFTGSINNYYADIDDSAVVYELEIPSTVGPFEWGEVALVMQDGTVFAIGTRAALKKKDLGVLSRIQAKIALSGGPGVINFPVQNLAEAKILELATLSQLNPPDVMASNAYWVGSTDELGDPIFARRKSDKLWSFANHCVRAALGTANANSVNTTEILFANTTIESDFPLGKYLVQITSGPMTGTVRRLVSATSTKVVAEAALGGTITTGTTFAVLQSVTSKLASTGGSGGSVTGYGPGVLIKVMNKVPPANSIKANGAVVLRASYVGLDAAIYVGPDDNATAAWGYRCTNSANPSGSRSPAGDYIVLPDCRARVGRALDDGRGIDVARSLYSYQEGQMPSHVHGGVPYNVGDSDRGGWSSIFSVDNVSTTTPTGGTDNGGENRMANYAELVCITTA